MHYKVLKKKRLKIWISDENTSAFLKELCITTKLQTSLKRYHREDSDVVWAADFGTDVKHSELEVIYEVIMFFSSPSLHPPAI